MVSHSEGRRILVEAWKDVVGDIPSAAVLQIVGSIAALESGYGSASFTIRDHETGKVIEVKRGMNNWGATHSGALPPCPEGSFEATDTNADKSMYETCFNQWDTPERGASEFLRRLLKTRTLAAVRTGSIHDTAVSMRRAGYFVGHGATEEERIQNYEDTMRSVAKDIARALHEPFLDTSLTNAEKKPLDTKAIQNYLREVDAEWGKSKARSDFLKAHVAPGETLKYNVSAFESDYLAWKQFLGDSLSFTFFISDDVYTQTRDWHIKVVTWDSELYPPGQAPITAPVPPPVAPSQAPSPAPNAEPAPSATDTILKGVILLGVIGGAAAVAKAYVSRGKNQ